MNVNVNLYSTYLYYTLPEITPPLGCEVKMVHQIHHSPPGT